MIYRDQRCGDGKEFGIIPGAGVCRKADERGEGPGTKSEWRDGGNSSDRMSLLDPTSPPHPHAFLYVAAFGRGGIQEAWTGASRLEAEKTMASPRKKPFGLENCEG